MKSMTATWKQSSQSSNHLLPYHKILTEVQLNLCTRCNKQTKYWYVKELSARGKLSQV